MKKIVVLIIFICFLGCRESSQNSSIETFFEKVGNLKDKQTQGYVYYEDFFIPQAKWNGSNALCNKRFENKSLVIKNDYHYDVACMYTVDLLIDKDRDFEIETKLAAMSGNVKKGHSFVWGKSQDNHWFGIALNREGSYCIYRNASDFHYYVEWKKSDLIKINAYNNIRIRKLNGFYNFYINDEFVSKIPFEPFYGEGFGYQCPEESVSHIDYIKIRYIGNKGHKTYMSVDTKLQELMSLKEKIDLKKQKVIGLQKEFTGSVNLLKQEISNYKMSKNIQSLNQGLTYPRIKNNLRLIQEKDAYIKKLSDIVYSLTGSSEELRYFIVQKEDKLKLGLVFEKEELASIIEDIENTVKKYAPEAEELELNISESSKESLESIWENIK